MKTRSILCLLLFLLLAFGNLANAESIRCGGKLIEKGDSRRDVIESCGEPDAIETILWQNDAVRVKWERLVYERGDRRIIIKIAAGMIDEIREFEPYDFECRGKNITEGDSRDYVLENCGPPDIRQPMVFGPAGSDERGERFIYRSRKGSEEVTVIIKDKKVFAVALETIF